MPYLHITFSSGGAAGCTGEPVASRRSTTASSSAPSSRTASVTQPKTSSPAGPFPQEGLLHDAEDRKCCMPGILCRCSIMLTLCFPHPARLSPLLPEVHQHLPTARGEVELPPEPKKVCKIQKRTRESKAKRSATARTARWCRGRCATR